MAQKGADAGKAAAQRAGPGAATPPRCAAAKVAPIDDRDGPSGADTRPVLLSLTRPFASLASPIALASFPP